MTPSERLGIVLAPLLDADLRYELRRLTEADSQAHQLLEFQGRAQRAEDLAAECQRQLHVRDRQCDEMRARLDAGADR